MWEKFKNLRSVFFRIDSRTVYLYSFFIGVLTGGVAILFYRTVHFMQDHLFESSGRFPIFILIIPALGGLMVGLVNKFWAPEAQGTGVDLLLNSFHNEGGQMRRRTPFAKFIASSCTLGTGGSAGKEGPMALIGAGIGTLLGRWVKMGARARRTLLLAGSAGGLGAIFRSPLGGAITAVEVLYKEDLEADALLPCIISSVTAYTIFSTTIGFGHILSFEAKMFTSPIQLLFYAVLGLFCSGASYFFVRLFGGLKENFFDKLPIADVLKPALGGLLMGLIALFLPKATGEGVDVIQNIIFGQIPDQYLLAALFLLALAVVKMLSTTLTIQSGGSGGVLIPSLFIGAMLGGFFGVLANHFFPHWVPEITPFIVVGMAAFFSSVTNASLGALVMVTEMTGGYELLPPLMLVGVISLITSRKWSIYRNQVTNKFSSQAHLYDMNPMNLIPVKVGEAFHRTYHKRAIVTQESTLLEIERHTQETHATDFIVAGPDQTLVGLFSLRDTHPLDEDLKESHALIVAKDLLNRPLFFVTEEDNLYQALKVLMDSDFDKVPVVRLVGEKKQLLGYLRHQDILEYYYRMGLQHAALKTSNA